MEKLTFDQLPQAIALLLEKISRIEQMLSGLPMEGHQKYRPILTTAQAAEYMGISMSALYKLTSRKELPMYKPGGKKVYLKREEIDDYLAKCRISSQEEIEKEALDDVLRNPLKLR
ncbi:helix-turn-helix domain-containing protein [Mucilaginibacter sp. Bleaf8]|uniref:helix-turn-helix domain-containing protein n=1 Tax=Mucilaginibacter sp. Bleaf8 TaxID=2834430 RepID=UPI001BCB0587|nr:helix-turn-helix domain-containing protein [Mucilaginibacter sp. Bleaf8]MBS7565642.1 helix-turn-helix domain-containing protein [Mucilaginibacter sp. Bleaf8]